MPDQAFESFTDRYPALQIHQPYPSMTSLIRNLFQRASLKGTAPPLVGQGHQQAGASAERTNQPPFTLAAFPIDSPTARPLRVIIIGAGFSGICAGIRFLQRVPNVEVVIYEKNEGVGGTWWSNRYPYVVSIIAHI